MERSSCSSNTIELRHLEELRICGPAGGRASSDRLLLRVGQRTHESAQSGLSRNPTPVRSTRRWTFPSSRRRVTVFLRWTPPRRDEVPVQGQYREPIVFCRFQIQGWGGLCPKGWRGPRKKRRSHGAGVKGMFFRDVPPGSDPRLAPGPGQYSCPLCERDRHALRRPLAARRQLERA